MMKNRVRGFVMALISAIFAAGVVAAEDHTAEAQTHTQAGIEHGGMGHAQILAEHVKAALTHAEAAEKVKKDPHMEEGIVHLKAAIAEADKGNAEAGTQHAKQALEHIKLAAPTPVK